MKTVTIEYDGLTGDINIKHDDIKKLILVSLLACCITKIIKEINDSHKGLRNSK